MSKTPRRRRMTDIPSSMTWSVLLKAGVPTKNGRVYTSKALQKMADESNNILAFSPAEKTLYHLVEKLTKEEEFKMVSREDK